MKKVKIAASILTSDFSQLGNQVKAAINAGVEYLHIDVMDGHFVPNLTIGPLIVSAISPLTKRSGTVLDVHLMINNPDRLITEFADAGADNITVHVETCKHLHRTIQQIKELGIRTGVTLNPATPLIQIEEILPYVDLVLIMSVNPGYGGQTYIPTSTQRITRLKMMLSEKRLDTVEIEVDGGIKAHNVIEVVTAGATVLVIGSAIYNQQASVSDNVGRIRKIIESQNYGSFGAKKKFSVG